MEPQKYVPPGKEIEFSRLWDKAMRAKENLDRQLIPAKHNEATVELLKVYEEIFEWGMK